MERHINNAMQQCMMHIPEDWIPPLLPFSNATDHANGITPVRAACMYVYEFAMYTAANGGFSYGVQYPANITWTVQFVARLIFSNCIGDINLS